ncbi:FtsB family cell division protein [Psychromicrobium lacuslunae]|uniref:Septation ring formation regulator EzrA n=1 Tax=Psychromicrobium lacuslunae TaxID=1618207 RepID=A0A0D4BVP5_9MICC|nr:septum formation initiator family protein [Psychromicrobium lacuslunae]AJT40394.1 hypothetical protein UM93_00380 [Psychromicrobium lacuslunae]
MATRRPKVPHTSRPTEATSRAAQEQNGPNERTESVAERASAKPKVTVEPITKHKPSTRSGGAGQEKSSAAKPDTSRTVKPANPAKQKLSTQAARARATAASSSAKSAVRTVRQSVQRKGSTAKAAAAPVPARSFSGRLIALLVVFAAVAVILAPSLNTYLQQRANIASLKAEIAAEQQQQKDLQNQISRWNDPAYIKQQARDRVNMMMPGETGYWVYGGSDTPAAPQQAGTSSNPDSLPWTEGLWQSIVRSATE